MSAPYIETSAYEASHGRKPRGIGYWAFAKKRSAAGEDIFWVQNTYAEAKRAARAHFDGAEIVFVLP